MFSSKEEFAKAMLDGRQFRHADDVMWCDWRGCKPKFLTQRSQAPVEMCVNWSFYGQVEEILPWYERIPKNGVLCWVRDCIEDGRPYLSLVFGYLKEDDHPFVTQSMRRFRHATPLTLDEARRLLVEE